VRPGDELVLEVTMDQLSARGGWGQATASVDGKPACRARIFFVLAAAASGNGTAAG
jgi:3-hydroxymyristoyl/3-hydroxydecanoyl-(acyl carrier protein) dehydratase